MKNEMIIKVQTMLTTDILIPTGNNMYDLNAYGDRAKFISQATLIDGDNKVCKILRFESREDFDYTKVNIHEAWEQFHKLVSAQASTQLDAFVDSHTKPNKILI